MDLRSVVANWANQHNPHSYSMEHLEHSPRARNHPSHFAHQATDINSKKAMLAWHGERASMGADL